MKKHWPLLVALQIAVSAFHVDAGTVFYVPIPATQSDGGCGIGNDNQYTSAVDGGNTRGTDRVINGITLYALVANGQSSTADNCTLNALAGSLSNAGGASGSIQADGVLKEVLSDMTFNNGATDNSQQEIVLDPDSLESGATYDLRVYICNSSGQNRQVNLAFVGDGQAAVETGFFNEDDARTSAGGFSDRNQVYYVNYRFTWDGDSTPGITITQKVGSAPFVLYALTNQVVTGGAAAGEASEGAGLTTGLVNTESDEVGVASDDFYTSESLNTNGQWVKLDKWGTCWQPTKVASGWCPYTNGNWKECDDCGWTFVSDEPWAWCCYHYGRWAKVKTGCGWCWVPGRVWASSWVSWRQGKSDACSCIGWAPLPPEASCELNVGVSTWVDRTCDIGPDCYTFINLRDFGSDSYSGCGCLYERSRNIGIIIETINITNIFYNRNVIYCGGPDFKWCNEQIRKHGGKECEQIHVNRYDDPGKMGGKFSKKEGNQLALLSPHVKGDKNSKHSPKTAEHIGADKIDKGWGNGKDKKLENQARNHIAEEGKGKDPKNTKATLPSDVAQKIGKHHGGGQMATQQLGGKGQHPGGVNKGSSALPLTAGGQAGGNGEKKDQHPGKGQNKGQANTANTGQNSTGAGAGFDQHPGGGKGHKGKNAAGDENANALGTQTAGASAGGGDGGHHPGQSLKSSKKTQGNAGNAGDAGDAGNAGGSGGGKHHAKTGQSGNQTNAGATSQGGQNQSGSGGGQGVHSTKSHHKQQSTQSQMAQGGGQSGQSGGGSQSQGGSQSGKGHHKQSQTQGQTGQGGAGQGGSGGAGTQHHLSSAQQQQLQQQQQQQQLLQQQQQQGGGKKKKSPTPRPH